MQSSSTRSVRAWPWLLAGALLVMLTASVLRAPAAAAQEQPEPVVPPELPSVEDSESGPLGVEGPALPQNPMEPDEPAVDQPAITVDLSDAEVDGDGSGPLQVILVITLISLAPALLILVTAFTRIVVVLGLARNALNLQGIPPNQVIIGLALFLTLFVMAPVFREANEEALQPFLNGEIEQGEAFDRGVEPFKEFMLGQVREEDLALFIEMSGDERPETPEDVALTTLVPAYVISELRAAFLIGFVIFVPFLIIDMVVSAGLMSMGMVMLPPVTIALPFKLLLFVLVDGWRLLAESLVASFAT